MDKGTQTSAGWETAQQSSDRIKAQLAASEAARAETVGKPAGPSMVDILAERLAKQATGISTSTSSNLQATIEQAIAETQTAGRLSSQALQSERQREVAFAQDRAGAEFTGALEGRTGYATQVVALRELTETTEKSIRDLDQRYQEAIMRNDANTAQRVADLRMQKLEFLQQQEQNLFSNMIGVANLQQEALSLAQQNEQFWEAQKQRESEFARSLKQSEYQFEKNYGLELDRIALDEQRLEIDRERNRISMAEYQLRKSELNKEKTLTNMTAFISQDMKSKIASGWTEDQFLDSAYLAQLRANLGFEGTADELSKAVMDAYNSIKADGSFDPEQVAASGGGSSFWSNWFSSRGINNQTTPMTAGIPEPEQPAPNGFLPFNF